MDVLPDDLQPRRHLTDGRSQVLSVIVPVFNEAEGLAEFHRRLAAVLDATDMACEVVYVNDGSGDGSMQILRALHADDARVTVVDLSRNFGKEIAMSAGLDLASGDAVAVIDADLQDPPELIPSMIAAWREGADVVLMRRRSRVRESWWRSLQARLFYRTMRRIGVITIPEDVGDFRLLSRRTVLALRRFPERSRFMKGLFAWVGYPTREIVYDRDGRYAGKSKWSSWRLWNLALEGFTSFSAAPLKVASYVGGAAALGAFAYACYIVVKAVVYGDRAPGFPTLATLILLLGGLQLMALGIIGEYLARMFIEVKQRPLYFVQAVLPAANGLGIPAGEDRGADAGRPPA